MGCSLGLHKYSLVFLLMELPFQVLIKMNWLWPCSFKSRVPFLHVWCVHDHLKLNQVLKRWSILLCKSDPLWTFVQESVENKSWLADDGVGVVSHVFTTNDSWRPNPTLCGALDGLLCLCLYPRGGQRGGQMVKQATSCLPCLHFLCLWRLQQEEGHRWLMRAKPCHVYVFYQVCPSWHWSQRKLIYLPIFFSSMSAATHFLWLFVFLVVFTALFVCFLTVKRKRSTGNGQFRFSSHSLIISLSAHLCSSLMG